MRFAGSAVERANVTLAALIAAIAASGEQASNAWRHEYLGNVSGLHAAGPANALPGKPPIATVVPLDTLGPSRLTLTTRVSIAQDGDGAVTADFTAAKRHWWNRTPRNVSTLTVEWDRREAPEGVCRIRDKQNEKQDKVVIDG